MRDHVRFRSEQFAPPDVEPWQIGSERFGYALATWVAAALGARGFAVDIPVPEQWGWLLDVRQDARVVRVGCENVEGSVTEWMISLETIDGAGAIRRLLRRASSPAAPNAAYGIAAAIHGALHGNPHTSEIVWFRLGPTDEEIDHADSPI